MAKYFCKHCDAQVYSWNTLLEHLDRKHDVAQAIHSDFEDEKVREKRLAREAEAEARKEAERLHRAAVIADFEIAEGAAEFVGVWTVRGLFDSYYGRGVAERDPWDRFFRAAAAA